MFLSNVTDGGPTPALVKTLAFNEARLKMIVENVANLQTPGYRAKQLDPKAFQHALQEALVVWAKHAGAAGDAGEDRPAGGGRPGERADRSRVADHRTNGGPRAETFRRGTFTSVAKLEAAIEAHIQEHNHDPQAFLWTAGVATILAKVRRARKILDHVESA